MFTSLLSFCTLVSVIQFTASVVYTCDLSATCGCSTVSSTSVTARIVGGEAAPNRAWGWMLSLRANGNHICGASLITSEFAVTAAHCLNAYANNVGALTILAGTNYLDDQSSSIVQKRNITAIYIHPNFDTTAVTNDIGLLRFAALTTGYESTLSFVCLPSANQDPFSIGDNLIAIGWGVLSSGSLLVSNTLRQVTVQAVDSSATACQRAPIQDTTVEFCAGTSVGGKDTCQGDSGGPLMAFRNSQWILAGITSSGIGCASADHSGLYTRVSTYVGYIQSVLDNPEATAITTARTTTATGAAAATITASTQDSGSSRVNPSEKFVLCLLFSLLTLLLVK